MRCAIYSRKSTEQGGVADEAKSVTRQVEHATAYAVARGWTVSPEHVFVDDGVSGAEFAKRPGLVRLLNVLKPRPPFQVLVMSEESRLGREQIETAYCLKQLLTAGVRVFYYLEDRERTLAGPTDKLLLSVTSFADEMERERARQRATDTMRRKAEAGHVTGGVVFGYDNVRVNGHVERAINPTEADVVRRIFTLAADGWGVRRIAHALNAEAVPGPTPRRTGRPRAWSPSALHEMLTRPLYRGEVVWNRTQKRDVWGTKRPTARAEREWIRREVPALRIVPAPLWEAVEARLAANRATYLHATGGRLGGRPPSGSESKYLLTGLATCGCCGGALVVHSRASSQERRFGYRCSYSFYRGETVCANRRVLRMLDTNAAVLQSVEAALLTPAAVAAIVEEVLDELRTPAPETTVPQRAALQAELQIIEAEIGRLTTAIAQAPDLGSLIVALRQKEQHQARLQQDLARLDGVRRVALPDAATLTTAVLGKLGDWSGLMGRRVGPAREILRKVLVGRLAFTPQPDGTWSFVGYADPGPLFAGTVLADRGNLLVSPTGQAGVPCPLARVRTAQDSRRVA